jgi:hypothetical protein
MGRGAVLSLKITGDSSGGKAAIDDVDGHASKLGGGLGKLAGLAAGAFAVDKVLEFGKASFDAASNLEQMAGSVDAVFGKSAGQIDKLAAGAHKAVGLSTADYDQLAAVIGSQLKNAGTSVDQLVGKTSSVISMGADMSAVFGGTAKDAVDALSSALKGEMDPIEKYGVSLNQNALNAQMAADGARKVNGQYTAQAKAAAVLELVTKQTGQTHGQFAKQSGTAAEKSQQLGAWFDNLKAKIGGGLLPIFSSLATFFTDKIEPALDAVFRKGGPVATMFGQVSTFVTTQVLPALKSLWDELSPKLVPIFHQLGHVVSAILIPALKGVWGYIKTYLIPIFKSVLGPVIDGISTVFHKVSDAVEKNKGKFVAIYEKVKPFLDFMRDKVAPFLGGVLKGAFELLGDAIGPVVDLITWVLDKAGDVLGFIGKVGGWLFGGSDSGKKSTGGAKRGAGVFGASAGGGRLATSSLGGSGVGPAAAAGGLTAVQAGDTYNITVQGALDPAAVADQIARLLDARARRTGGRVAMSYA